MARTATRQLPLRQMREAAGLTLGEAADKISQQLARKVTPEYVRLLEYRGTGIYDYISAFSCAYQQPIDAVAAAAKAP